MGPWWRALIDFFFPPRCSFCGENREGGNPVGGLLRLLRPNPQSLPPPLSPLRHRLCQRRRGGPSLLGLSRGKAGISPRPEPLPIMKASWRKSSPGSNIGETPVWPSLWATFWRTMRIRIFPFGDYLLVIPVPLHPRRLRRRGFNQSLLLARRISRRYSLPLNFTALRRIRATAPQTELSGGGKAKEHPRAPLRFSGTNRGREIHPPDRRRLHDRGDGRGMRQGPPQSRAQIGSTS